MIKNNFYLIIFLTVIWIILCENLSLMTVATGIAISVGCAFFCRKLLPELKTTRVKFFWLAIYPFYLIGQVYISGFSAIKRIILADANVDVIEIKTQISNDFLKIVLSNSITLTPGTITLDLSNEKITVLWLHKTTDDPDKAGKIIKDNLEKMLLKAQK